MIPCIWSLLLIFPHYVAISYMHKPYKTKGAVFHYIIVTLPYMTTTCHFLRAINSAKCMEKVLELAQHIN